VPIVADVDGAGSIFRPSANTGITEKTKKRKTIASKPAFCIKFLSLLIMLLIIKFSAGPRN